MSTELVNNTTASTIYLTEKYSERPSLLPSNPRSSAETTKQPSTDSVSLSVSLNSLVPVSSVNTPPSPSTPISPSTTITDNTATTTTTTTATTTTTTPPLHHTTTTTTTSSPSATSPTVLPTNNLSLLAPSFTTSPTLLSSMTQPNFYSIAGLALTPTKTPSSIYRTPVKSSTQKVAHLHDTLNTPVRDKDGAFFDSFTPLKQSESDYGKSKRKRCPPEKRPLDICVAGPSQLRTDPNNSQDGSYNKDSIPTFVEKVISETSLAKALAANINKKLYGDSKIDLVEKISDQKKVEEKQPAECDKLMTDILLTDFHMTKDDIEEVIDKTSNDGIPVLDDLLKLFASVADEAVYDENSYQGNMQKPPSSFLQIVDKLCPDDSSSHSQANISSDQNFIVEKQHWQQDELPSCNISIATSNLHELEHSEIASKACVLSTVTNSESSSAVQNTSKDSEPCQNIKTKNVVVECPVLSNQRASAQTSISMDVYSTSTNSPLATNTVIQSIKGVRDSCDKPLVNTSVSLPSSCTKQQNTRPNSLSVKQCSVRTTVVPCLLYSSASTNVTQQSTYVVSENNSLKLSSAAGQSLPGQQPTCHLNVPTQSKATTENNVPFTSSFPDQPVPCLTPSIVPSTNPSFIMLTPTKLLSSSSALNCVQSVQKISNENIGKISSVVPVPNTYPSNIQIVTLQPNNLQPSSLNVFPLKNMSSTVSRVGPLPSIDPAYPTVNITNPCADTPTIIPSQVATGVFNPAISQPCLTNLISTQSIASLIPVANCMLEPEQTKTQRNPKPMPVKRRPGRRPRNPPRVRDSKLQPIAMMKPQPNSVPSKVVTLKVRSICDETIASHLKEDKSIVLVEASDNSLLIEMKPNTSNILLKMTNQRTNKISSYLMNAKNVRDQLSSFIGTQILTEHVLNCMSKLESVPVNNSDKEPSSKTSTEKTPDSLSDRNSSSQEFSKLRNSDISSSREQGYDSVHQNDGNKEVLENGLDGSVPWNLTRLRDDKKEAGCGGNGASSVPVTANTKMTSCILGSRIGQISSATFVAPHFGAPPAKKALCDFSPLQGNRPETLSKDNSAAPQPAADETGGDTVENVGSDASKGAQFSEDDEQVAIDILSTLRYNRTRCYEESAATTSSQPPSHSAITPSQQQQQQHYHHHDQTLDILSIKTPEKTAHKLSSKGDSPQPLNLNDTLGYVHSPVHFTTRSLQAVAIFPTSLSTATTTTTITTTSTCNTTVTTTTTTTTPTQSLKKNCRKKTINKTNDDDDDDDGSVKMRGIKRKLYDDDVEGEEVYGGSGVLLNKLNKNEINHFLDQLHADSLDSLTPTSISAADAVDVTAADADAAADTK